MRTRSPWGIHWFRRDLRLRGNPALLEHCSRLDGRVLGLFCVDPGILARPDLSVARFAFFLETLAALRAELRERGGDLLVVEGDPAEAVPRLLDRLRRAKHPAPVSFSWNRDYEPYALQRDSRMERLLEEGHGIHPLTARDHLLVEPRELFKDKDPGSFYQVYTPFKKRWLGLLATDEMQGRVRAAVARAPRMRLAWDALLGADAHRPDLLEKHVAAAKARTTVALPPAGEAAALKAARAFARGALEGYGDGRDIPSAEGTSRMSVYLKNGSITVAGLIADLGLGDSKSPDAVKYLSELAWREFYYHILFHVPRVAEGPFHLEYASLRWENDERLFEAWKEGRTGFPIVDAGMRQLRETGWMHNRVRMIVASFLTKDLLIDWRWGERYFMTRLLDGDLAPNNGGWQWAASTGCDPQPYFRIFNPELQLKRFDPRGRYVRRWVPEHGTSRYPSPVVEHAERAKRAVALYRAARG